MKVLFDHQIFSFQNFGGASIYFSELMHRLGKLDEVSYDIAMSYTNNIYAKEGNFVKAKQLLPNTEIPFKNYFTFYLNNILNCRKIKSGGYDVFHPTYYHPYFLKLIGKKPYVITVLDMIHELFSDDYKELTKRTINYKRETIKRADAVIAISENTKKDIINIYDIDPKKISVVYLAGATLPKPVEKFATLLPEKYLLYVGTRKIYKNFDRLLLSIKKILKESEFYLVCAGGGPFSNEEMKLIESLKITKKVKWVGFRGYNELAYLYKNAYAHIISSLYEGFEVTILEAFSMNCPVIAGKVASLPEVGGDAVFYIDPESNESIGRAVQKLINDKNIHQLLVRKGREQLTKFSWDKCAKETLRVYEKAIAG